MKGLQPTLLFLMIFSLFWGCDTASSRREVQQGVVNVADAAREKAKETFAQFEQNWKRTDIEGFSIKLAMKTDSGDLEHIWFTPSQIDDKQVTATCANDPISISGLKFGDVRTVDRSAVSDWMILENGKCYGGYTIRVLSERDPSNAPPLKFADYPSDAK
jgi:uncharacterized protein YegJ (DUF2314 family)